MQRTRLNRQDELILQLESHGGSAFYDTAFDQDGRLLPQADRSTGLLAKLVGEDLFRTVEGIRFRPGFDRKGLALLPEFRELKQVSLAETSVGDEEAAILARLSNLERLDLRRTKLSSRGLRELSRLPRLVQIQLGKDIIQRIGEAKIDSMFPTTQVD